MMVYDIEHSMPPDELIYWVAYFEVKDAKIKKLQEAEKAKQGVK